jgi:hypothetical protein
MRWITKDENTLVSVDGVETFTITNKGYRYVVKVGFRVEPFKSKLEALVWCKRYNEELSKSLEPRVY